MTDITSTRVDYTPALGGKVIVLKSGTTVVGGTDTLTLTLEDFGIKTILAVQGFRHSTDGSVIVAETMTTAVADGVLTITTGASNNNERRVAVVYAE